MTRRLGAIACATVALLGAAGALAEEPKVQRVGYYDQIFVADRDGKVHRLTHGHHSHGAPVWAPGGRRLATFNEGDVEVRTARGGRVLERFDGGPLGTSNFSWSPDGRQLAFARYFAGNNGHLVVVSVDGRHERDVTHHAGNPEWSRDGRTIFYLHGREPGLYESQEPRNLYAIPSRGGDRRRIAVNVEELGGLSPDGRWLLFTRPTQRNYPGAQLWIARTDGSVERSLGDHSYIEQFGWAPGHRGVYVISDRGQVVVLSMHGKARRLRAKVGHYAFDWSPDGRWVAWSREDVFNGVLTSHPDGSDKRVAARFAVRGRAFAEIRYLAWSPDSRRLAIVAYRHEGD